MLSCSHKDPLHTTLWCILVIFIPVCYFKSNSDIFLITKKLSENIKNYDYDYILDSSNFSSFTFWSSKLASTSRSNWTGIWTVTWNGSWTDKHSSHFSTAKEIHKCKSYILFHVKTTTNNFWNDAEMLLKSFWTSHLQMMNGLEPLF